MLGVCFCVSLHSSFLLFKFVVSGHIYIYTPLLTYILTYIYADRLLLSFVRYQADKKWKKNLQTPLYYTHSTYTNFISLQFFLLQRYRTHLHFVFTHLHFHRQRSIFEFAFCICRYVNGGMHAQVCVRLGVYVHTYVYMPADAYGAGCVFVCGRVFVMQMNIAPESSGRQRRCSGNALASR